jgi:hypothetical protein
VMINILLFAYSILKVFKMVYFLGDSVSIDHEPTEFEALGNVTLEDAQFTPFFAFKHPNEVIPRN